MEKKKFQTMSIAALIISVIPFATLIPAFLKIILPDGLRTVWSGVNIACVIIGLCLSIICVKNSESRSLFNIISTIIAFRKIVNLFHSFIRNLFVAGYIFCNLQYGIFHDFMLFSEIPKQKCRCFIFDYDGIPAVISAFELIPIFRMAGRAWFSDWNTDCDVCFGSRRF